MDDPDLTPAQEEAVRRHLAAARHDQALPADVAARMDDVVARLAAERSSGVPDAGLAAGLGEVPLVEAGPDGAADDSGPEEASPEQDATVTPLRRRRWPQALLAAAAVAAIGVGVTQVLPTGGPEDNSAVDAGASPNLDRDSVAEAPEAEGQEDGAAPETGAGAPSEAPRNGSRAYSDELDLLTDRYLPELARIPGVAAKKDDGAELQARRASACGPATLAPGATAVPVLYRDREALAVFGPESDPQRVAIYVCDSDAPRTPVVTVRIPAQE